MSILGLRPPRLLAPIATCAVALLLSSSARGQGTFGALPDPITTRELAVLLEQLDASADQVDAAEVAHDAYKSAFARLRDMEMATFLRMLREDAGTRFPDRRRVDARRRRGAAVRRRIERLDESLFDEIGVVLTDGQRERLPRVRAARARARRLDERTRIPMDGVVDLAAIVPTLDLAPADRAAADPVLVAYEQELGRRLETIARANRGLDGALLDRMDALGFVPSDIEDPARRERVFAAMRDYWSSVETRFVRLGEGVRSLGRRACDDAARLVSPPARRRLRDAYYRAAYPDLEAVLPVLAGLLHRIGADADLSPDGREAVAALRAGYEAEADAMVALAADAIDALLAARSPFDTGSPEEDTLEERLHRDEARAMARHESVVATLREIVGPELVARYRLDDARAVIAAALRGRAGHDTTAMETDDPAEPDLLPPALGADEVAALAVALGLDDAGQAALEALRVEHRERHRASRAAYAGVGRETTAALDSPGADADAHVVAVWRARARHVGEVRDLDEAFARGARELAGDEAAPGLEAWERARARAVWSIGAEPDLFPGAGAESLVDLPALIAGAGIDRRALAPIEPDLVAFEERLGRLLETRYADAMRYMEAFERLEYAPRGPARDEAEARLDGVERGLVVTSAAIASLNRAMLKEIVAALEDDAVRGLRRAYDRAAHPHVFRDRTAVGPALERALARGDLTPRTAAAVAELAATYRAAYEALCRAMIELDELAARGAIDRFEHRTRTARLRFDRDELNARAERRLRVLTDGR
jgi:hypothetical protein